MEFISKAGIRISYRFKVGVVISIKSWIYRGVRDHEIWIRGTDGREWLCCGLPVGVNLTRGQRIAFAWCKPEGQSEWQMVAVKNCSSGHYNAVSDRIGTELGVHRYGRRAFRWLTLLAAGAWVLDCLAGPSGWIPHLSFVLAGGVMGGSMIGFLLSCLSDPDPERLIDKDVSIALSGVEHAWIATDRPSGHGSGRMQSVA